MVRLTSTISRLQTEVGELKSVVDDLRQSSTVQPFESQDALPPASAAASNTSSAIGAQRHLSAGNSDMGFKGNVMGRGRRGRGGRVGLGRGGLHDRGVIRRSVGTSLNSRSSTQSLGPRHKVKVEGARRVWGTLSVCSVSTIQSAIRRLCTIDSVRVRRKSKEMPNGKVCWWFVLHDDEANLQVIDAKWEQVELQTSWKLEPCYRQGTAPVLQSLAPPTDTSIGGVCAGESTDTSDVSTHGVPSTTPTSPTSPPTHENPDIPNVAEQGGTHFLVNFPQPQPQLENMYIIPNNQLNIVYYNARSLLPKIDEITETESPDVTCIVETWLSNNISDNELVIPDYQIFRRDRDRHGGGTCVDVCSLFFCCRFA